MLISSDLKEWSHIIYNEIINDGSDYFWPKSNEHKIFEQAYMKFVNRNLNYFDHKNMLAHAVLEEQEYNKNLPKTLEFCNFVKDLVNKNNSPFGRMCVWNIPPKHQILAHIDNFIYHSMITRYIFIVSDHPKDSIIIKINDNFVNSNKGVLFQFYPAFDKHEFINNSDSNFYFLGFDIWNYKKLQVLAKNFDLKSVVDNPKRYSSFGGLKTNCKYISKH